MEYPNLTREESSRCKLTEEQIETIRELYREGYSTRKIASFIGVGKSAVWYWVVSEQKREEINKNNYQRAKRNGEVYYNRKAQLTSQKKLRTLHKEEFNLYSREYMAKMKKQNPERYNLIQERIKIWREKNPLKVKIWQRRQQVKNNIKKYQDELKEINEGVKDDGGF